MADSAALQQDLSRVALGDRAAFARVYRATSAHLFGVALRILGRRDAAEDVLQETYVSVWNHAGSYQAATSQPMTWLISIVTRADGVQQWAFKSMPLYFFAGDAKPGEANGDKQGGVWHVIRSAAKKSSSRQDTNDYASGYSYTN